MVFNGHFSREREEKTREANTKERKDIEKEGQKSEGTKGHTPEFLLQHNRLVTPDSTKSR